MTKKWYLSKTIWLNVVTILIMIANECFKIHPVSAETSAIILAILNIILRKLTTAAI